MPTNEKEPPEISLDSFIGLSTFNKYSFQNLNYIMLYLGKVFNISDSP